MVSKIFGKISKRSGIKSTPNQQLSTELHKPIIKKFKVRKVYSSFKSKIWVVDLADIPLISKYNKGIRYLYVLLIFLVNMHGLFL